MTIGELALRIVISHDLETGFAEQPLPAPGET